jgi:hypothetical protein
MQQHSITYHNKDTSTIVNNVPLQNFKITVQHDDIRMTLKTEILDLCIRCQVNTTIQQCIHNIIDVI